MRAQLHAGRMDEGALGAVIYVRVSTEDQANGPLNLSNQESKCKEFCLRNGLEILKVFVDPGESARSTDRPEFQKMLKYCKARRKQVRYVVVQDLSRFARNLRDQAATITELAASGIGLRSVYEPNIGETAAGKLAANIYGTFNQYFSDALSEKMRDRTQESVRAGRYPWPAPIGYRNVRNECGPNIAPDDTRAPLIREAFELMATGLYKKSEVLQIVTEKGLRTTRNNQQLSPQTFVETLRKPVYCGWLCPPSMGGVRIKGLHEPIVSEKLFNTVQEVLLGRQPTVAVRKRFNPELPLKGFLKCANCGTPLTGAFCTGKNKTKKYPRYWCRNASCRSVKASREQVERDFVKLLRNLQPEEDTVRNFPKVAAKVWAKKQGDADAAENRLAKRLQDQEQLKSELLRAKLRGEIAQEDYIKANAEFAEEIANTKSQLDVIRASRDKLESFLRFSELMLSDIAGAWEKAEEQKGRVQNLLFQDGLMYSSDGRFLNTAKPCLYMALEEMQTKNGILASPTGFEPVLSP